MKLDWGRMQPNIIKYACEQNCIHPHPNKNDREKEQRDRFCDDISIFP